jgi:adenine-specific DNA-methyltransferase
MGQHVGISGMQEKPVLKEFSTPTSLANLVATLAIDSPNSRILDPCAGSGQLLSACMSRLSALDPAGRCERSIFGFEADPDAAERAQRRFGTLAEVRVCDFLLDVPSKESFDSIVCNPPYDRHHILPRSYKARLSDVVGSLVGSKLSGLSSEYVYFFVKSFALLRKNGVMVFITPDEYLETDYGRLLRRFFLDKLHVEAVIRFAPSVAFFPGVMTSTCITVLKKGNTSPDSKTILATVKAWPGYLEVYNAVSAGQTRKYAWGEVLSVDQRTLERMDRWHSSPRVSRRGRRLGELFEVHRGIATGSNDFFLMTEEKAAKLRLPKDSLVPIVRHARDLDGLHFTEERLGGLLTHGGQNLLFCQGKQSDRNVARYIAFGEALGVDESTLCRSRKPWFRIHADRIPDIFCSYMRRGPPVFSVNETNARSVNTVHCLYARTELDLRGEDLLQIVRYLNSHDAKSETLRNARDYAEGLMKLEPGDVSNIRLPDGLLTRRSTQGVFPGHDV